MAAAIVTSNVEMRKLKLLMQLINDSIKDNKMNHLVLFYDANAAQTMLNIMQDTFARFYIEFFLNTKTYSDVSTINRIAEYGQNIKVDLEEYIRLAKTMPSVLVERSAEVVPVSDLMDIYEVTRDTLRTRAKILKRDNVPKFEMLPDIAQDTKFELHYKGKDFKWNRIHLALNYYNNKMRQEQPVKQFSPKYSYFKLTKDFQDRTRTGTDDLISLALELLKPNPHEQATRILETIGKRLYKAYRYNHGRTIPYDMNFNQPHLRDLYTLLQYGPFIAQTIAYLA